MPHATAIAPLPDTETSMLAARQAALPHSAQYPAVDHFSEAYGAAQYAHALATRGAGGLRPLSLQVEVPFCRTQCLHCNRQPIITHDIQRADRYVGRLAEEAERVTAQLAAPTPVLRLHLSGGTPNYLPTRHLALLWDQLNHHFHFAEDCQASMTADPRYLSARRLTELHAIGYRGLHLLLPELDDDVLQTLQRPMRRKRVLALMQAAHDIGWNDVRLEIMTGLPRQTDSGLRRTLQDVLQTPIQLLRLVPYWHLPQRFAPQRLLDASDLPDGQVLHELARNELRQAGWLHLGLDRYVPPSSPLRHASGQGRLRLDAVGYHAQPDTDTIGLGLGAVSRIGTQYAQNCRRLVDYEAALQHQLLPIQRGHVMSADDLVRQGLMHALFCQGEVDLATLAEAHLLDHRVAFAREWRALQALARQGLVWLEEDAFGATATGFDCLPQIAAVFDRYARHAGTPLPEPASPRGTA